MYLCASIQYFFLGLEIFGGMLGLIALLFALQAIVYCCKVREKWRIAEERDEDSYSDSTSRQILLDNEETEITETPEVETEPRLTDGIELQEIA